MNFEEKLSFLMDQLSSLYNEELENLNFKLNIINKFSPVKIVKKEEDLYMIYQDGQNEKIDFSLSDVFLDSFQNNFNREVYLGGFHSDKRGMNEKDKEILRQINVLYERTLLNIKFQEKIKVKETKQKVNKI